MARLTPIKAIRKKCLDCQGNHYSEVRNCVDHTCPLLPYRMGKRPADGKHEKIDGSLVKSG